MGVVYLFADEGGVATLYQAIKAISKPPWLQVLLGTGAFAAVKQITVNNLTFAEKAANKITSLGLAAPAILLLEAHKPLAFIGSQLLLIVQPTLNLFLSQHFTNNTIELLADSHQFEQLITHLERDLNRPVLSPAAGPSDSGEVNP